MRLVSTVGSALLVAALFFPPMLVAEAGGARPEAPARPQASPATLQSERGSGLELRFVPYPWRPDVFQSMEQGAPSARGWAFARLVVSSYFTLDGTRLEPGHYAMIVNPRTGALPMTLELRRVDGREFLVDPPAMAPPPPGETVYKRPLVFAPGAEPVPVLGATIASWSQGSLLTVRWGDRKLLKELPRAPMP